MIQGIATAQAYVLLALGLAALLLEVWALVEAVRTPAPAYEAAGKLTKPAWVGITAVAALIGFVSLRSPFGVGLLGVVAAGVFLADVRPAVRSYLPRGRGKGGSGPYGSW